MKQVKVYHKTHIIKGKEYHVDSLSDILLLASFVFGIIEHCEPKQLLERERYYINLLNPEYNSI